MPLTLKQLEAEALALPPEQRAALAERLFASLEDEGGWEDAAKVEQAWLEEAERRYWRYLAGQSQAAPADEVIARVRARCQRR